MSVGGYDLRPRQLRALLVLLILLPLLPSAVIVRFFADAARYERSTLGENWRGFYGNYARALAGYAHNQVAREFDGEMASGEAAPEVLARQLSQRGDVDSVVVFGGGSLLGGEVWREGGREAAADAPAAVGMIGPLRDPEGTQVLWRALPGTGQLGRVIEGDGWWLVVLRSPATLKARIEGFVSATSGPDIRWVVTESATPPVLPAGVAGREPVGHPLDLIVPGWMLWIGPSLESARSNEGLGEQIRLYQEVSVVMLGAVLALGLLAGWAITRQIRLQDLRSTALAAVAHELKTPIASSRLLLETLASKASSADHEVRDYVRLLARDNERLARIISDFLLFSKLEQKRYQPKRGVFPVGALIDEAVATMRATLREAGVAVEVRSLDTGVMVEGDRDVLARALVNLIANAVKHSGENRRVVVAERESGARHVELVVSDEGPGIPPGELRRIFRPFHQVDARLSRSHEGAGLGLSIVKQIVAAHGGGVWAESDGRSGATFIIRLPKARGGRGE